MMRATSWSKLPFGEAGSGRLHSTVHLPKIQVEIAGTATSSGIHAREKREKKKLASHR